MPQFVKSFHTILTKDLLDFGQDLLHNCWATCDLEIVNVLGHDADQLALVVSAAKLWVDLAGNEVALVAGDHAQLDAEGQGCID